VHGPVGRMSDSQAGSTNRSRTSSSDQPDPVEDEEDEPLWTKTRSRSDSAHSLASCSTRTSLHQDCVADPSTSDIEDSSDDDEAEPPAPKRPRTTFPQYASLADTLRLLAKS
jgi:hypothetical protein